MKPLGRILREVFLQAAVVLQLAGMAHGVAGDDLDDVLSNIQQRYDSIKDATCTFVQTVQFGVTKSEQRFQGTLWIKKGNKYRIEGEDQTIVTDGSSVWSYSPVTNQVLIDRYRDDPGSFFPDRILTNLSRNYSVSLLPDERVGEDECRVLKMAPKDELASARWLKVWVSEETWLMTKVQVLDVSENLTTYEIRNIKLNAGLADTRFSFDAPKGSEVIDLR